MLPLSRASASLCFHPLQSSVDYLVVVAMIQHVQGGHFARRAATRDRGRRVLHERCVVVVLQEHVRAFAGAKVGLILLRGDHPVPAEFLKVHGQGVQAAVHLLRAFLADQAGLAAAAVGLLGSQRDLQKGILREEN